jgi:glycosyltransferase involved in cell wall biosynthesis
VTPASRQTAPRSERGRRVRVLTLVDYLSSQGGAERFALQVATGLDPERFESIMCASRWPLAAENEQVVAAGQEALSELERTGTRFFPLRRQGKADPRPWLRLGHFLRSERIEILHAHKFGSNLFGVPIARAAGVPVVVAHEHTWSYEGKPWRRFLDREVIARGADRFVAVSRADQRRMSSVERIDPARTGFIPIGILPSTPRVREPHIRRELGIDPDALVLAIVGLLRPQKAHEVLLRAMAQLLGEWPGLQLLIVGNGPERGNVERVIDELGLGEHARILGLRADVPEILAEVDVGVCCSDFEGSPLAVLEYMDTALPIASTAVGGIPDLIESGVHGLLVPARDHDALAAAIAQLLRDPERAREMGARARERRRTEFELTAVIGQIEDLYRELLTARGRFLPAG